MARKEALLRLHQNLAAKRDMLRKKLLEDLNLADRIDNGTGDIGDAAADGSRSELDSQLAALESRELNQIDRAMELIRQGRYGACEICSERIPMARLKALPFTPLCIDCQRKQETMGRRGGSFDENWESAYEYEGAHNDRELTLNDIDIDV